MNRWLIITLFLLMIPSMARSEMHSVTLRDAITLALENSHLLKYVQYENRAAEEAVSSSRSRYLPRMYLQSGAAFSDAPSRVFMMKLDEGRINPSSDFGADALNHPSGRGDFYSALTIEQPLMDFSIGTGAAMMEKERDAKNFTYEQKREDVSFRVMQTFLEVRRAIAYEQLADKAVADAKEHQRLAIVRNNAGVGLKSDELRARTYLSQLEGDRISAKNDLVVARMRLNNAIGGKAGEQVDIRDEALQLTSVSDHNALIQQAMSARADLKVVEVEVQRAMLAVGSARNAYLPTMYANASYQINDRDIPFGTDNRAWTVGLNIKWELFDGLRRKADKASAEAMQSAARESLENFRNEVALQVSESYLRLDETAKRTEVARNAVQDAEEGVRLIGKRFENSLAAMVELLDAQSALNKTRANLVEVENFHALTKARILYSVGIFLKETK